MIIKKTLITFCFITLAVILNAQPEPIVKIKRKTPEPGTRLSIMSRALIKQINKGMEGNPDSTFLVYDKKTSIRRKPCFNYVDTFLTKNNIRVRIYYPRKVKRNTSLPIFIFYHGGAYIWGSIDTYNNLAGKLCRKSNSIVIVPEYRLAPDSPFPNAVNDCFEVYQWVQNNAIGMGGDRRKIGLIGDSAGGALSAVTTLKAFEHGEPDIAFQILLYPNTIITDTLLPSREYFMGAKGPHYLLSEELVRNVQKLYLKGADPYHPYASPYFGNYNSSMPPTLVITADCDPLRDEGELLAMKFKENGMETELKRYKGMIHGFVSFYKVMPSGKKAIRHSVKFAKKQNSKNE